MNDDELLARLKRLEGERPERPAAEWDAMAAGVRAALAAERPVQPRRRRRVWAPVAASTLAVAAALVLWLRPHPAPRVPSVESLGAFGGEIPIGEQIEELDAESLERLDRALKQGA